MYQQEIKKDFPILEKITYLDSGATTQKPIQVIKKVEEFYTKYNANPHRGAYTLSMEATEIYENTRTKIAKFINAKYAEEIIFSKNATESLNLIAYSYGMDRLKKDDEIESKITDNTKIVVITHVSNVTGTINNIKKIIKYAHKKGAIVIVDASQSIPHMKIDVQDLDADFLVFSGHKMLAPLGIGVLYGKKEILNKMNPFLMGGDEQDTTFAPLPNKFEAGTQNVEGVVGLGAAIDYIQNIGYDKIQEIEKELTQYAREELSKLNYLTLYLTPNEENHSSVISFNINGVHPHDVASILDSEGVCVRSGNHCAQPLMRYLGIDSTCRASFYFYNTKEDVDKLVKALNKAYEMFKKYIKV